MKLFLFTLPVFVLLTSVAFAQEFEPPKKLPSSKKEFVKSEPDFINAAKWLENTAIDTTTNKRFKVNAWVMAWVTNSPTVTVDVDASIINLFEKNSHLMLVWIAGYAKYSIENSYSTDKVQCNVAGIKAAIHCYNLGGQITNDENLNKVIDADKNGKLEDWVKDALKSK